MSFLQKSDTVAEALFKVALGLCCVTFAVAFAAAVAYVILSTFNELLAGYHHNVQGPHSLLVTVLKLSLFLLLAVWALIPLFRKKPAARDTPKYAEG